MIRLRRQTGRYKIYTIDIDNWLTEDRREDFMNQLDILLTGQDAEEGFQLVSIVPFQDEYIVVLKA